MQKPSSIATLAYTMYKEKRKFKFHVHLAKIFHKPLKTFVMSRYIFSM